MDLESLGQEIETLSQPSQTSQPSQPSQPSQLSHPRPKLSRLRDKPQLSCNACRRRNSVSPHTHILSDHDVTVNSHVPPALPVARYVPTWITQGS
ncbi:hypothetical protein N7509_000197 [Penicillium cosmopolitanum]|uniref:Uncharacterized protein n=1 Tax=Penicillium cosmopolitanum TaxID=1131564 RepID=A0A9W9WCK1_9EURO|nr:uncharacterized protein N7509_000197 [Penicillium cosmopolitanum]KAJ5414863.1 hypothetical protein N7509_000197 [Penicillium cosmopolitanum]